MIENIQHIADLSAPIEANPCCVPLRVLNLYAGVGGNRELWENVEVTAVEYNEKIAAEYKSKFPNDTVIVAVIIVTGKQIGRAHV